MLIGWKHIVALALCGLLSGILLAWSGLVGVGASGGHWKATDWFLHWIMRSSVRTAAFGTKVPEFTTGMLPMAAAHFEAACASCHGSPSRARPVSVDKMLPEPPELTDRIPTWSNGELFQIVRHGVRFTGMPAWPVAGRDDEVWAMVAFLRQYPMLDAEGYRSLAGIAKTRSAADDLVDKCNDCHEPSRLNEQSLIPRLAGQSRIYLEQALAAYAHGTRPSGIMAVATQTLRDEDRRTIARLLAGQPTPISLAGGEETGRGEALALKGDPVRRIPACLSCHDNVEANPAFPRLSGQPVAYLVRQLNLFTQKARGGGPFRDVMTKAAADLKGEDIDALARYFSWRKPSR